VREEKMGKKNKMLEENYEQNKKILNNIQAVTV